MKHITKRWETFPSPQGGEINVGYSESHSNLFRVVAKCYADDDGVAEFIAAAPETAAERDALGEKVKRLEVELQFRVESRARLWDALNLALECVDERDIPVGDGKTAHNSIGEIIRAALSDIPEPDEKPCNIHGSYDDLSLPSCPACDAEDVAGEFAALKDINTEMLEALKNLLANPGTRESRRDAIAIIAKAEGGKG